MNFKEEFGKLSDSKYNNSELTLQPVLVNLGILQNIIPNKNYEIDFNLCYNTVKYTNSLLDEWNIVAKRNGFNPFGYEQLQLLFIWSFFMGFAISHEFYVKNNDNAIYMIENTFKARGFDCLDEYVLEELLPQEKINANSLKEHLAFMGQCCMMTFSTNISDLHNKVKISVRSMFLYGTVVGKELLIN